MENRKEPKARPAALILRLGKRAGTPGEKDELRKRKERKGQEDGKKKCWGSQIVFQMREKGGGFPFGNTLEAKKSTKKRITVKTSPFYKTQIATPLVERKRRKQPGDWSDSQSGV